MSDPNEDDLSDFVSKLHASFYLETWISPSEDGKGFDWKATLNGEDFLDGYWKATRSGTEKTFNKALKRTIDPKQDDPWYPRRYRDRGEWSEVELATDRNKGR